MAGWNYRVLANGQLALPTMPDHKKTRLMAMPGAFEAPIPMRGSNPDPTTPDTRIIIDAYLNVKCKNL